MPIVILIAIAAWLVGVWVQGTYVFVPAAVLSVVVFAGIVMWFYLRAVWDVLTDRSRTGIATPPVRPPGDRSRTEPAFIAYPLRQIWLDLTRMVKRALTQTLRAARDAVGTGRDGIRRYAVRGSTIGITLVILLPTVVAVIFGAGAGVLAGLASYVGLAVATFGLMLVISMLWLLGWLVLGSVESVLALWRRIRQSCPYAGCYRGVALPAYDCPGCEQRHRRLRPNEYGLLRHDCRCGAALPTAIVLGRHRMPAYCPHCDRRLPQRIGRVPVVTVPVVGGPAAGKSTFICLSVDALRTRLVDAGARVRFAEPAQERLFTQGHATLRRGDPLDKTVQRMPDGTMLDVGLGGRADRILYLFDPAGESYAAADGVEAQGYLDHAEGLLVVVDPLALDPVLHSFTEPERETVRDAVGPASLPAGSQPEGVVGRLFDLLRSRSGNRIRRIAVIVSKSDALAHTAIGHNLTADNVRAWLRDVGWGNNVRLLEQNAAEVRYFRSGLHLSPGTYAEPLRWLADLPVNGTAHPTKDPPPLHPDTMPRTIPRGYRTGRLVTLATSMLAGATASIVTAAAVIGGLTGAFDRPLSASAIGSAAIAAVRTRAARRCRSGSWRRSGRR